MTDLKKLSAAATPGPWSYRPDKHDDWGMIRGGKMPNDHIGPVHPPVASARPVGLDYDLDEHRWAGTDPMEPNGLFIVELVNAYREGRLIEKATDGAAGNILDTSDIADKCTCSNCWPDYPYFRVCPDCGNKRCPKARHHDHTCTNSNEPGQKGSNYE